MSEETTTKKKAVSKSYNGTVLTIKVDGVGEDQYDYSNLPLSMQSQCGLLGFKTIMDAGGKKGDEAREVISAVYNRLMASVFTVPKAARAKTKATIDLTSVAAKIAEMAPDQQAIVNALLSGLGIQIPEVNA